MNFACFIIKQNNLFIASLSREKLQVSGKSKFVFNLYKHTTKNYRTVSTKCHSFTTTSLDRGEWQISRSDRFSPQNTSEYHLKKWLDGRRDEQQTQSPPGWAPTAQSPRFTDSRREVSFPYLLFSLPKVQRPHRHSSHLYKDCSSHTIKELSSLALLLSDKDWQTCKALIFVMQPTQYGPQQT